MQVTERSSLSSRLAETAAGGRTEPPGRFRSLARWSWALFRDMPLAPIALFESGLLQECRGNHADAQARFDVATRFGDPRMRARLTEVRWALPPPLGGGSGSRRRPESRRERATGQLST